jgi:hypothetical protein
LLLDRLLDLGRIEVSLVKAHLRVLGPDEALDLHGRRLCRGHWMGRVLPLGHWALVPKRHRIERNLRPFGEPQPT